jgi:hypothetical protein
MIIGSVYGRVLLSNSPHTREAFKGNKRANSRHSKNTFILVKGHTKKIAKEVKAEHTVHNYVSEMQWL